MRKLKRMLLVLIISAGLFPSVYAGTPDVYGGAAFNIFPISHPWNLGLANLRIGFDASFPFAGDGPVSAGGLVGFYFLGWMWDSEYEEDPVGFILSDIPLRLYVRFGSGQFSVMPMAGAMILFGMSNWYDTESDSAFRFNFDIGVRFILLGKYYFETSYEFLRFRRGYLRFAIGFNLDVFTDSETP